MQLTWPDTFYAHTAFKHTLFALHCLPCALVTIYTSGASNTSVCARARTVYAPITRDDQRLRSLCARVRKIFERKTAARRTATRRTATRRDGAFRGVSTNFLNKASHLTAFYAWYYSSPHLPVTPAQLMRPGIGRNASCAVGDFA